MSCDLFFYLLQVVFCIFSYLLLWRECKRSKVALVSNNSNNKNTQSNDKKMAVDKFAFSFDLFNSFTKYTLNPEFDTQFSAVTRNNQKKKRNCFQITDFILLFHFGIGKTRRLYFSLSLSFFSMQSALDSPLHFHSPQCTARAS